MLDPTRFDKPDFYLKASPYKLKQIYTEVCCQLINLYTQLHDAEVAERNDYDHAFYSAETTTVAGAERYAKSQTKEVWAAVGDCKRDILSYECERDMLLNLIEWNNGE